MASRTFDGVRFAAWSDDHIPPHVHGYYAGIEVVLDLIAETEEIVLANRAKRVIPANEEVRHQPHRSCRQQTRRRSV